MPTTNPVPSADPSDLLFNAGALDRFLTSPALTFTDRLGNSRRTLAGADAEINEAADGILAQSVAAKDEAKGYAQEAFGYLQTYRATSYGAYADDPAADPLGNPPTVGDEYFNTAANLLKRWNGTSWQASDINTANLAAPTGSALVGYDGGTAQDVLDGAVSMQDYPQLDVYTGRATCVRFNLPGHAGFWQRLAAGATDTVNGGTVRLDGLGRKWRRLWSNEINAHWFMTAAQITDSQSGAPVLDHTAPIQAAIDFAKSMFALGGFISSGGVRVRIPAGQYRVQRIIRRTGVEIVGDGSRNTVIMPIPWDGPGGQDPEYGLLEIESGPVSAAYFRGITLSGASTPTGTTPVNPNQWGVYSRAKWSSLTANATGGLWYSEYSDVWVRGFAKGEWSRAGYLSGNVNSGLPNQFILYDGFVVQVVAGGEARRFTGQHGEIAVRGGDSGGLDSVLAARAITCDWDPNPAQVAVNTEAGESVSHVAGVGNAVRTPEQIEFVDGAGVQRANLAAFVRNTRGVKFDNCWFETLGSCFDLQSNGGAIVTNSRFANAADGNRLASPSAGNGFIVQQGTNTNFEFGEGNTITGVFDRFYASGTNLNNVFRSRLAYANVNTNGKTAVSALPTITTASDGSATVNGHQYAFVRSNQADLSIPVSSIVSMLAPSQMLTIRAWNGPLTLSNSGGNIRIGSNLPQLTVPEAGYVTLLRIPETSGVEWVVQGRSDYTSDTLPTAGYHAEGTRIWKINQTPSASPGWICTTAGIPGTWSAMPNIGA